MTNSFNPYHEWLGLGPHVVRPNYYQLIGISPSETDTAKIAAAADRAMARVRACRPGPRTTEWSALLDEIATAKQALTNPGQGSAYTAQAGGAGSAAPAPRNVRPAPRARVPAGGPAVPTASPASTAGAPTVPVHAAQPAMPTATTQGYAQQPYAAPANNPAGGGIPQARPVQAAAPVAGNAAYGHPGAPGMTVPVATAAAVPAAVPRRASPAPVATKSSVAAKRRRERSKRTVIVAGTAAAMMILGAFALLLMLLLDEDDKDRANRQQVALNTPVTRPANGANTGTQEKPRTRPTDRINPRSENRYPAARIDNGSDRPIPIPGIGSSSEPEDRYDPVETYEPVEATQIPAKFGPTYEGPVATPRPSGTSESMTNMTPADAGSPTSDTGLPTVSPFDPPAESTPTTMQPENPPMSPFQEPVTPKPMATGQEPTAQDTAQLNRALSAAWQALEDKDFDTAFAELDKAERIPMPQDGADRYQRLHLLGQYARSFDSALTEAIGKLHGGDDIEVGNSTVVGVVETAAGKITVKVAGANRTYTTDTLPAGLAIAIVETHLDKEDPVSLVTKAAYLATLEDAREDRLSKAREWFREAAQKGVEIGDLEKVLDDRSAGD